MYQLATMLARRCDDRAVSLLGPISLQRAPNEYYADVAELPDHRVRASVFVQGGNCPAAQNQGGAD